MIVVGFIGLATAKSSKFTQVQMESVEIIILSALSAILTLAEASRLDNILSYIKRKKLLD